MAADDDDYPVITCQDGTVVKVLIPKSEIRSALEATKGLADAIDRAEAIAAHEHEWKPAPVAERGRYVCACGATGYRKENGEGRGKIVPHKERRKYDRAPQTHVGAPNMEHGNARRGRRGPGGW